MKKSLFVCFLAAVSFVLAAPPLQAANTGSSNSAVSQAGAKHKKKHHKHKKHKKQNS